MADPTLRQLATFLAAADDGSVSGAARRFNLTQPAASQQLRQLERSLGVRPLERAGGRLMPTAAGAAIAAPARRAQAAAADLIAAAAAHRIGEAGKVRLGTGATACIYLLPPLLVALRRRMPGLTVTIATGNTPEILRRIEGGDLDIGLVTLASRSSRALVVTRLFSDPLLAVMPAAIAPPAHRLRPSQLARLPLVLYESGGNTRAVLDAWFRRAGLSPRPMMELGSVEAIKAVIAGGLGASVLPRLALADPIPGTVMRPLYPVVARELGYVLRREKVVDRGLRAMIEALETLRSD
jgi:DNA-binding transcriptional LysR family regulator